MIFYKFKKMVCGPNNSALISDKGEVFLQGLNDYGQLALGDELGPLVPFFPEFRKIDPFSHKFPVIDVGLGMGSAHILAM